MTSAGDRPRSSCWSPSLTATIKIIAMSPGIHTEDAWVPRRLEQDSGSSLERAINHGLLPPHYLSGDPDEELASIETGPSRDIEIWPLEHFLAALWQDTLDLDHGAGRP
ncbi:MAG: hypothetical protein OXC31_23820 [Spirochaetaceae bacterium]|nr:hypothetical protein [Spirochaetaceae bacterium]